MLMYVTLEILFNEVFFVKNFSEGGMVRWNFSDPFEANVVPKYLQEIAGK